MCTLQSFGATPSKFQSKAYECGAVLRPWLSSFKSLVANIDFNSSHVDEYQVSYFPYPIWRDAGMHDLIVRVALSAANAVAQSGRCMRMGQHVMLRVDIALTRQGDMVRLFGLMRSELAFLPGMFRLTGTSLMGAQKHVQDSPRIPFWGLDSVISQ